MSGKVTTRRSRALGPALTLLRVALAFMLAFGSTLWVQMRLADDAFAAKGNVTVAAKDDKSDETSSSSSSAKADEKPYIMDIAVFEHGTTKDAYAFALKPDKSREGLIELKTGFIDFDGAIEWNDESWEYESPKVTWKLGGDAGIATLSSDGVLKANGTEDGTVRVTAVVSGEYTEDGKELTASFNVVLRGQTATKYVTNIVVCDDTGAPIDPSYRFEEGTLATAMLELQAKVTVMDPETGSPADYQVTPSSGLAKQTGGEIADILWESADTRLGTVSDEGVYRPLVEGTNKVTAYSDAGFSGKQVTASATIDMPGEESGDYHPQNTLTVKVYYEKAPDQEVASKTYSIDDLEDLGTETYTYTAVRGASGYFTTTGRGPLLVKVLEGAGVNTDGVARLRFGTPDNYQGVVSWDMLVDKDRYYFPNIDQSSYAGKEPVPPIIAIEAHRNVGTDPSPNYDFDDQRRFLLLFGSKDTGETVTNLQVYNIHTLYVELEGAPPVQPGHETWTVKFVDSVTGGIIETRTSTDPDNETKPEAPGHDGYKFKGWNKDADKVSKTVTYTAVYEASEDNKGGANKSGDSDDDGDSDDKDDEPEGDDPDKDDPDDQNENNQPERPATPPNNGGAGDAAAQGGAYDLIDASGGDATGNAGGDAAGADGAGAQASASQTLTELSLDDVTAVTPGRWSALQAMNRHPSNVADLMYDNPFAPYAAPTCAGVFVAGGLEALIRFRWQKRVPKG